MTRAAPVLRPPPTAEQLRAADPATSVWVTASAGTGKTRVLADRVLRLLLGGAVPAQILCLTFTKAAAAEMVARVQADLGRFATQPDRAVRGALRDLLGRDPTRVEVERAGALFAEVLDLPAGLPIMTIHGFCQSLLRRFPIEAGVPPHFEVIEPRDAADHLREAREEVLASRRPEIRRALDRLAVLLGENPLAEGLAALTEARLRLREKLADGGAERLINAVHRALGVPPDATIQGTRAANCADPEIDAAGLTHACRALAVSSTTDHARAAAIAAWLELDPDGRAERRAAYEQAFLTQDRQPRKSLIARKAGEAHPEAAAALAAEQARLMRWIERENAAAVAERTAALLRVGAAVLKAYHERKQRLAVLDYDDLIDRSRQLLHQDGIASWVHYKLDQQIDHLLVDEGQDTSPEQWAIVEALSSEFFSGAGARPADRTLFVVGDEKQSIMSFQGADLDTYQDLRRRLGERARAAGQGWAEAPLDLSFRSAAPILELVDAVFASPDVRDGVVAAAWPRHRCSRGDAPGRVEVWPLIAAEPKPPSGDGWELPDRRAPVDQAERRLARMIAERIAAWRRDETVLPSTGRPITAGDVMVLLPRRGVLQDLLVRQLKRLDVPVAGADRLALTDEIAVLDLMALGDAVLLPEDDLTLAALLKSPLFGLSDEELFDLAYDRGRATLFERLRERRTSRPAFRAACDRFTALLAQADFAPPFEFYARALGEGGGRGRLIERLGHAVVEPVEAFLAQALAYERGHPPSLQGFLHWLRADTTELIRDPDQPRDEVRVLTVHGAKGLEAPIVFLTDTTYVPDIKDRLVWLEPEGLPLWKVGSSRRDPVSGRAHQRARERQLQEHRRLLYVALTRARDWLIVTGWERDRQPEDTWYRRVTDGMRRLGAERLAPSSGLAAAGWRYGATAGSAQLALGLGPGRQVETSAPPWLARPAPVEAPLTHPLSPSRSGDDEPPAASPLGANQEGRRRGRIVHKLLQLLPGRSAAAQAAAMARFLQQPGVGLDPEQQAAVADEVGRVLATPSLAALFGPGSRAEVPLAGRVGDQVIVGRIDRLAVTGREVLVVDYKTDRLPPATAEAVPVAYLRQMAAYRALLARIYPGRAVRAALLWTEGPVLMTLDDHVLARHAPAT